MKSLAGLYCKSPCDLGWREKHYPHWTDYQRKYTTPAQRPIALCAERTNTAANWLLQSGTNLRLLPAMLQREGNPVLRHNVWSLHARSFDQISLFRKTTTDALNSLRQTQEEFEQWDCSHSGQPHLNTASVSWPSSTPVPICTDQLPTRLQSHHIPVTATATA